jgi:hypothetical protein
MPAEDAKAFFLYYEEDQLQDEQYRCCGLVVQEGDKEIVDSVYKPSRHELEIWFEGWLAGWRAHTYHEELSEEQEH